MEDLTMEICREYQKRAEALGDNNLIVGRRKDLVVELQNRCGIPEIWAINIVNGYGVKDYLSILESKKNGGPKAKYRDEDYIEWLAQKEDKETIERMLKEDEMEK